MIDLIFFASIRERLGAAGEQVAKTDELKTVADLVALLAARGERWSQVLADTQLMVAVNQEMGGMDTALNDGDEVAIFPPVTGG